MAPPRAVRGLDEATREAPVQLLAAEESLGSFLLLARAPDVVGHAGGPRALAPELRLGAEVVEVLRELRRPWLAKGEAERGTSQGSPCGADKIGDAVKPFLVEVVDWAVAQELVHHEERDSCVRGNATSVRR